LKKPPLTVLALFSLAALAALAALSAPAPAPAQTQGMGVPENCFRKRPPVTEADVRLCEEFLKLIADDTFERSFIEAKLSKDFKVKPDRVRYACLKVLVIVILEASQKKEEAARTISQAYGAEALPTESEIALVKTRLGALALALNAVKEAQVEEIPWMLALYKL
jgi:hypothetical protein